MKDRSNDFLFFVKTLILRLIVPQNVGKCRVLEITYCIFIKKVYLLPKRD